MKLRPPETAEEFDAYYNLRWMVLRAPWNQPTGSEKDEYEGIVLRGGAYPEYQIDDKICFGYDNIFVCN